MSSLTDDIDAARVLMADDALLTDGAGKRLTISSLLPTEVHAVLVVVFIRHFSCGSCSGYVEALSTDVVVRQLQEHHARLIIVGHGAHTFIDSYKSTYAPPYDVYTARHMYNKLGLQSSSNGGKQPEWTKRSLVGDTIEALKFGLGSKGTPLLAGGGTSKSSQNGGEFILTIDSNGAVKCTYSHRMQTTRDHTPPTQLLAEVAKAR